MVLAGRAAAWPGLESIICVRYGSVVLTDRRQDRFTCAGPVSGLSCWQPELSSPSRRACHPARRAEGPRCPTEYPAAGRPVEQAPAAIAGHLGEAAAFSAIRVTSSKSVIASPGPARRAMAGELRPDPDQRRPWQAPSPQPAEATFTPHAKTP